MYFNESRKTPLEFLELNYMLILLLFQDMVEMGIIFIANHNRRVSMTLNAYFYIRFLF